MIVEISRNILSSMIACSNHVCAASVYNSMSLPNRIQYLLFNISAEYAISHVWPAFNIGQMSNIVSLFKKRSQTQEKFQRTGACDIAVWPWVTLRYKMHKWTSQKSCDITLDKKVRTNWNGSVGWSCWGGLYWLH